MQKSFNSQYYEAIIQVRPADETILYYAVNLIEKRKNVHISKIMTNKFGYDVYVSDRKYALAIGKKLKARFNGILKTSRILYGYERQSSKNKYRVVVCFRLNESPE